MIRIAGDTRINLVIGDDLTYWIEVSKGIELIDKIEFICAELSISETMQKQTFNNDLADVREGFAVVVSHTITTGYTAGNYTYSIRVTFADGTIRTMVYEENLAVLPKERSRE